MYRGKPVSWTEDRDNLNPVDRAILRFLYSVLIIVPTVAIALVLLGGLPGSAMNP